MRQIGVKNVKLSEYEMSIAAHLVDPLSMQVTPRVVKLKLLETPKSLPADGGATRKREACVVSVPARHIHLLPACRSPGGTSQVWTRSSPS